MPRLFILDANALLHRAWHALPPLTNPEGQVVNALYGTLTVVMKLLREEKPDAFVACWDTKAPTFRHEQFAEYKAQREKQADELYAQIPLVKEALSLLGIDSLALDGYEADDLLGTIAIRSKKSGWDVTIVTGDRDALQLVGPGISVLAFRKGVTDTILFDEAEVLKQYGITPAQMVDYKALRGDPSDNIPGMRGIGEKGAAELLQKFKDVKGIIRAAHDSKSKLTPSVRAKILAGEKDVAASLMLVKIVTDAPIAWKPARRAEQPPDPEAFIRFLNRMGFKSLVKRIQPTAEESGRGELAYRTGRPARSPTDSLEGRHMGLPLQRSYLNRHFLKNERDALAALEELHASDGCVVHVSRGAVGTLFANAVDGLVIGSDKGLFFFSLELIEKNKKTREKVSEWLGDPQASKIAHDAKMQMTALEPYGFTVAGWSFDTMLAAYLLGAGERNHDLPTVTFRYADIHIPDESDALRMAEAVRTLAPVLRKTLQEERLLHVFTRFELPLIPVLRDMERAGIMINRLYLSDLSHALQREREMLEKKMIKLAGRAFNPASSSQLAEVLFEDLKLSTKGIKRGKLGFSTAAPELEKLHGAHPIIEYIEEYRELCKMLSTYVETLPLQADQDGRVHTTFNQAVTATGRLSSSDPNMQNIPIRTELGRSIRRAFVAKKGHKLVSCDYSQIELRVAAALAKDEKMLAAFRRGDDIHAATAAEIWKIKPESVTKDQRRIAKAINFGLIFGQGPQGLSQTAGIPFAEAKKFIEEYFRAYDGIRRFMDETRALAARLGYVETLFGRRRPLPEIQSMLPQLRAQSERMAINMPVQGTEADFMKLAMIELHKKLPTVSPRSRMLLQVHDELVLEVPDDEVATVASFAKDVMENVEKIGVPIVVDVKAGDNWEEMSPIK